MRKYQYKESRNFARLLGMVDALQVRQECAARAFKRPVMLLKYKVRFYWMMLKLRRSLKRGRQIDFHSESDYLKLKSMWQSILKRTYEPRYLVR